VVRTPSASRSAPLTVPIGTLPSPSMRRGGAAPSTEKPRPPDPCLSEVTLGRHRSPTCRRSKGSSPSQLFFQHDHRGAPKDLPCLELLSFGLLAEIDRARHRQILKPLRTIAQIGTVDQFGSNKKRPGGGRSGAAASPELRTLNSYKTRAEGSKDLALRQLSTGCHMRRQCDSRVNVSNSATSSICSATFQWYIVHKQ
jgi:hypothetical protein